MTMETAVGVYLLVALGALPIVGLVIQVFRDSRGKRRNESGCCYACGTRKGLLVSVPHYKGDTFQYCAACARSQKRKSSLNGFVAVIVGGAICAAWFYFSRA